MLDPVGGMYAPPSATIQLNLFGNGATVSGYASGAQGNWQNVEDPLKRQAARQRQEADARGRRMQAEVDARLGPLGGPDVIRVLGICIPNGIIDQMQESAFQLQHARAKIEEQLKV